MSKLNRNTENQEHASHLPEHGPIDENGKEVLLSLKNVDITFGKGDNAVRRKTHGDNGSDAREEDRLPR